MDIFTHFCRSTMVTLGVIDICSILYLIAKCFKISITNFITYLFYFFGGGFLAFLCIIPKSKASLIIILIIWVAGSFFLSRISRKYVSKIIKFIDNIT